MKTSKKEGATDLSEKAMIEISQMITIDPKRIAYSGRHDDELLALLENFARKLNTCVGEVKDARKKEVLAAAKESLLFKMDEPERKKLQRQMLAYNICFACKSSSKENLMTCAGLKKDLCAGMAFCERCAEEVEHKELPCCSICKQTFLCSKKCDTTCLRKCTGCGCVLCESCAEKSEESGTFCECGNWFCGACEPSHDDCEIFDLGIDSLYSFTNSFNKTDVNAARISPSDTA